MSTFATLVQRGTRAAQPVATAVPAGTLYYVTDELKTERSSGTAWQDVSDSAAVANDSVTYAKMQNVSAASKLLGRGSAGGAGDPEEITLGTGLTMTGTTLAASGGGGGSGKVAQVVNTQTGAVATGTTVVPFDDTIPQNSEGDQYMSLAITPTSATNMLKIEVVIFLTSSLANWITAALFQDATAAALAAFTNYQNLGGGGCAVLFTHYMVAGTTSATTFKVRAGRDASAAGTVTFNGTGTARRFGGVMASSITITEIVP